MQNAEFQNVLNDMLSKVQSVLGNKQKEYAAGADKLASFKAAAAIQHCTPTQALAGMLAKHTVSINDMIQSGQHYTESQWNEKIIDSINYLILLKALVVDTQPRVCSNGKVSYSKVLKECDNDGQ